MPQAVKAASNMLESLRDEEITEKTMAFVSGIGMIALSWVGVIFLRADIWIAAWAAWYLAMMTLIPMAMSVQAYWRLHKEIIPRQRKILDNLMKDE